MRHSEETRQNALESIAKVGVRKTHEETGISLQTLYKWRNADKDMRPGTTALSASEKMSAAKEAIRASDEQLLEKIACIEAENEKLRAANERLKKALMAFIEG